jgi:CRISPR-associated endonuclease/helicase Cas3
MERLLAKSYDRQRYGSAPPDYSLLTQHSRDVAEACEFLAQTVGRVALGNANLSEDIFERFRVELKANGWIQDLGKANSHFQAMVSGTPAIIQLLRHETISGLLMLSEEQPFRAWLNEKLSTAVLLTSVWGAMGHHRKFDKQTKPNTALPLTVYLAHEDFKAILGEMAQDLRLSQPPTNIRDLVISQTQADGGDIAARESLRDLQEGFEDCEELFTDEDERKRLALIKGFGIGADVAASAIAARGQSAQRYSLQDFVSESLSVGLTSNDLSQIIEHWAMSRSLLPIFKPHQFQEKVAASASHLTFAQAGCGSGKSLAAYLWASKWCERFEREGRKNFRLFFCLPTTGTTTEHFKDYALESGIDAKLMSLTHSRSSVDLRAIAETAVQEEVNEDSKNPAQDALNAERDKMESLALWSTPLVVTTSDTVLGLMVNARRSIYSLPAMMCGAIVFDEVHAFDDQMFGHLLVFLKNFPRLPVLLMTASLPEPRLNALRKVRPDLNPISGPPDFERLERYVVREATGEEVWREVGKSVKENGKVLWVRNRVDWANETYAACRNKFTQTDVNVYHSRLRYKDRSIRHRRVIDKFKRADKAAIIVATQVAEMSLDLSADLLVTDIAPIPALIQRMGRLNRRLTPDTPAHERRARPALICPLPQSEPNVEKPYDKEEIEIAKKWLRALIEKGKAISQRDLSETFAQFSDEKEFDLAKAEERACFFSGLWQTRPGLTRGEGYTVSVLLQADKEELENKNLSGKQLRDEIRSHEVAIPIRDEVLKWDRYVGLRVAPRDSVAYDYDEKTHEGTGATWRRK